MGTPEEKIATEIALRDGVSGMRWCLQEAKNTVALRGNDNLDDIDQIHVRILAHLCLDSPSTTAQAATWFDIDEDIVLDGIDRLTGFRYVEYADPGYQPTTLGRKLIQEVGIEMLRLDIYKMKQHLSWVEPFIAQVGNASFPVRQ